MTLLTRVAATLGTARVPFAIIGAVAMAARGVARSTLARDLLVYTVAEGVETAEEAEVCMRIGFTHAQGFYFGRPVTIEEIDQSVGN